jgi:hypothetical protein
MDKVMDKETLQKILDSHKLWLEGKGGDKADLRHADLHRANLVGADLRGANLEFSTLPLWCGGRLWKVDVEFMYLLANHFCSMVCEDPEAVAARDSLIPFANKFHRAEELGLFLPSGSVEDR